MQRTIEAFGRLTTGDIPFRKAYLGAIIDCVEADDDQICIRGRKTFGKKPFRPKAAPCPGFAALFANGAP
jgi:hypothetical protein